MKKTIITFLSAGLLAVTGLKGQSIQEGMGHLYADRFKTAAGIFEKLLAVNPNNIEATYWLGQTYFDMDDNDAARKLYDKALVTNGSAPLVLVGLGHADLLDNKISDARQKFEAALTASRGKKGNDPQVATAIGRAIVDSKGGDFKWAVQLLEEAAAGFKTPPTETLIQLGNAYRKAGEGSGGGKAFETYKRALEINPSFAVASLRLAKLFESQKNYELVLENLNDAIKRDPKFTPAYYELFYYYFFTKKYDEAEVQLKKYLESKLPETEINDDSYYAQLCWARANYACAIEKDEKVVAQLGEKTKPRVLKLLADAYYQSGDYANAKRYIDWYFKREKPEDYISFDYKLKADIMAKSGGTDDEILENYLKGAAIDTVLTSKIDFIKQGAKFFRDAKKRDKEAILDSMIIVLKPNPTINDHFDLTIAHYFSQQYMRSREDALKMQEKFPDQIFGFEWAFNSSYTLSTDTTIPNSTDSIRKIYVQTLTAPDALKLYGFTSTDTAKFKKHYITSVRYLGPYYINEAKDKQKSLEFFKKWLEVDLANAEAIKKYIEQIEKMPDAPKGGNPKPAPTSGPANNGKGKLTTATKPAVSTK